MAEDLALPRRAGAAAPRERSDRVLLRGVRRGDEDALAALFNRHWPAAHRAAYLILGDASAAEDVAQEAMLKALASLDRYDRRRPFGPWLHRIAVNRAIDAARARGARRELTVETLPEAGVEDAADGFDPQLMGALAELPVEQRAAVVLRHVLGYTPGEIATILDLPRGTVNSRLRRALDTLAEDLSS